MSRSTLFLVLLLLAPGIGCAPRPPGDTEAAAPLWTSLQAYTTGGGVTFVLQITNPSAEPLELNFSSAQTFDFAVQSGGREIWRWSADRMFAQALQQDRLEPGATRLYQADWEPPPGLAGEFTVVGTVTSRDHPVAQATEFRLP